MINHMIESIQASLSRATDVYPLRISFWGNDIKEGLHYNYDFYHCNEDFLTVHESDQQPANIFLILGPLNSIQRELLKERYRNSQTETEQKLLVHVRGSIPDELLKKSYMCSSSDEDKIDFDFVYDKYPIDVLELRSKLIELVGKKRE